jgi:hypothetical protein
MPPFQRVLIVFSHTAAAHVLAAGTAGTHATTALLLGLDTKHELVAGFLAPRLWVV